MSENKRLLHDDYSILHEPDRYRYDLFDGEKLIGTASYMPDPSGEVWDFNSTHVRDEYRDRGLGAELVKVALTDAKASGHKISASCSYVVAYIREHPEFA